MPLGLDRAAVIGRIRHRHRVGFSAGIRPAGTLPSPTWLSVIQGLRLDVVAYAVADNMVRARFVNGLEVYSRTLRSLWRDPRITAFLLVTPTVELEPLSHAIHKAGKTLLVADLSERLPRTARFADGAFAIDAFVVGERAP